MILLSLARTIFYTAAFMFLALMYRAAFEGIFYVAPVVIFAAIFFADLTEQKLLEVFEDEPHP